MKLTKLGCYLLVFRANLRAFSHIFTTNNRQIGHMCVRKSHLEPRKKLIFLPQNQPCNVNIKDQEPEIFQNLFLNLKQKIVYAEKNGLQTLTN